MKPQSLTAAAPPNVFLESQAYAFPSWNIPKKFTGINVDNYINEISLETVQKENATSGVK